jgi:hypothetical protein
MKEKVIISYLGNGKASAYDNPIRAYVNFIISGGQKIVADSGGSIDSLEYALRKNVQNQTCLLMAFIIVNITFPHILCKYIAFRSVDKHIIRQFRKTTCMKEGIADPSA